MADFNEKLSVKIYAEQYKNMNWRRITNKVEKGKKVANSQKASDEKTC